MLDATLLKIRRGEGPFWTRVRAAAKAILRFQIPIAGPTRWLYRWLYRLYWALERLVSRTLSLLVRAPAFRARCERAGFVYCAKLPFAPHHTRIYVGDNVHFWGKCDIVSLRVFDDPELVIGDDVSVGGGTVFMVGRKITVGRHTGIANNVVIADNDGHPRDPVARARGETYPAEDVRPVVIEENCWIGNAAFIGKGVTIGEGSIVGARSVVVTDVPKFSVAMGNPARVVVKDLDKRSAPRPPQA